jgi:hypothetical protein
MVLIHLSSPLKIGGSTTNFRRSISTLTRDQIKALSVRPCGWSEGAPTPADNPTSTKSTCLTTPTPLTDPTVDNLNFLQGTTFNLTSRGDSGGPLFDGTVDPEKPLDAKGQLLGITINVQGQGSGKFVTRFEPASRFQAFADAIVNGSTGTTTFGFYQQDLDGDVLFDTIRQGQDNTTKQFFIEKIPGNGGAATRIPIVVSSDITASAIQSVGFLAANTLVMLANSAVHLFNFDFGGSGASQSFVSEAVFTGAKARECAARRSGQGTRETRTRLRALRRRLQRLRAVKASGRASHDAASAALHAPQVTR